MAISIINSNTSGDGASSSNTIQIPATSLTSGNLIVIGIRYNSSTATCSISDTAGNTYTQAGSYILNGTDRISMWYAKNTIGNANNVVTVSLSVSCTYRYASSIQVSGLDIINPLDTTASGTVSNGTVITSGSFTTSTVKEIIISMAQVASIAGSWTAGTGYTKQVDSYQNVTSMQYKVVSEIQTSVTTSMTNTNSADLKSIIVATFKELEQTTTSFGEYLGAGAGTTKLLLHYEGTTGDYSGNNNVEVANNITLSQSYGKFSQGGGFNGTNSYIKLLNSANINTSFTFIDYIKLSGTSGCTIYLLLKLIMPPPRL